MNKNSKTGADPQQRQARYRQWLEGLGATGWISEG